MTNPTPIVPSLPLPDKPVRDLRADQTEQLLSCTSDTPLESIAVKFTNDGILGTGTLVNNDNKVHMNLG